MLHLYKKSRTTVVVIIGAPVLSIAGSTAVANVS